MKWWWSGGVERKAKLLGECWTFLIYIFIHQQWKQCLEFTLAKLREICKYLAVACNSNSHARGLHYLTFVCKNKAGKSTQWGESSQKMYLKELSSAFTFYIFLHQQWKQCLEFTLAKLREICKYLAGACNSNSHARGLHYLTFVCKNKAGKSTQWGESSQKMYLKELSVITRMECEEVSLQIKIITLPPKNHNLFVRTGTKREFGEKGIAATS